MVVNSLHFKFADHPILIGFGFALVQIFSQTAEISLIPALLIFFASVSISSWLAGGIAGAVTTAAILILELILIHLNKFNISYSKIDHSQLFLFFGFEGLALSWFWYQIRLKQSS